MATLSPITPETPIIPDTGLFGNNSSATSMTDPPAAPDTMVTKKKSGTVRSVLNNTFAWFWVFASISMISIVTVLILHFVLATDTSVTPTPASANIYSLSGYRSAFGNPDTQHPFNLKLTVTTASTVTDEIITVSPGSVFEFTHLFKEGDSYQVDIVGDVEGKACAITNSLGIFGKSDITDLYLHCPLVPLDCSIVNSSISYVSSEPSLGLDMNVHVTFGNLVEKFVCYMIGTQNPITPLSPSETYQFIAKHGQRVEMANPDPTSSTSNEVFTIVVPHNRHVYFSWYDGTTFRLSEPIINVPADAAELPETPVLTDVKLSTCPGAAAGGTCVVSDDTANYEMRLYREFEYDEVIGTGVLAPDHTFSIDFTAVNPTITSTYYVRAYNTITQLDSLPSNLITKQLNLP